MIPNEASTGSSVLRRENDHVSHVGNDGSALSSEVGRALILHRNSAIHGAPEDTNAHAMGVATSTFTFSVTDTTSGLSRPCL